MRSLIEMMIINPMITMSTIVKYRLGQALVQLASDTVMFLGIMYSAANQGVRELAATKGKLQCITFQSIARKVAELAQKI